MIQSDLNLEVIAIAPAVAETRERHLVKVYMILLNIIMGSEKKLALFDYS